VSAFHTEVSQQIVSEGLAQGPYVAARATLRTKGVESTNEPSRPTQDYSEVTIKVKDRQLRNYSNML